MKYLIITTLLLIGITSLVETSNARTLRFETWTSDLANQDLTLTPSGTGQVNIGGDGLVHEGKTTAQRTGISSPTNGLMIYDSDIGELFAYLSSSWEEFLTTSSIKSVLITDASGSGTVSQDNDDLINGNCTNTGDTGDYVCTFQSAYTVAPHCEVQSVSDEIVGSVSTSTTTATIQFRKEISTIETATLTGSWTTNTTYSSKVEYRGEKMVIDGKVSTSGAPDSTPLTITIPVSKTFDTGNAPSMTGGDDLGGTCNILDSGTAFYKCSLRYNDTTSFGVSVLNTSSTYSTFNNVTETVPMNFASGDTVKFKVEIPISSGDGIGTDTDFVLKCKEP